MTQEQLNAIAKAEIKFYTIADDDFPGASNFSCGIHTVISNPTDFGLVSLETMFEFAEYLTSKCTVHSQRGDSHRNSIDGYWYTTQDLFELFTQNKEK